MNSTIEKVPKLKKFIGSTIELALVEKKEIGKIFVVFLSIFHK